MGVHIHDIEIKNFKSIRHAKIEDCRRVNVFIGYPNVGKSNILEAIGLLTFIRQKRPTGLGGLVRLEKMTQLFHFFNIQEPSELHFNNHFTLEINYDDEEKIDMHLRDSRVSKTDVRNILTEISPLKIGFHSLISGQTNDVDDFSGRVTGLKSIHVKPYKFKQDKNFHKSYSALELKVPYGENMFEVIINNAELKTELSGLLRRYGLKPLINITESSITLTRDIEGEVVYSMPFSLIADTLARLIYFKTAIHSNRNSVLVFEEPEAHMFPPYIQKLTGDIMYDDNNNQYFIATHSPFVLNDLMEDLEQDQISIYTVGYSDGQTKINRLTDQQITEVYQYGVDLFFNLEDYLKDEVS